MPWPERGSGLSHTTVSNVVDRAVGRVHADVRTAARCGCGLDLVSLNRLTRSAYAP